MHFLCLVLCSTGSLHCLSALLLLAFFLVLPGVFSGGLVLVGPSAAAPVWGAVGPAPLSLCLVFVLFFGWSVWLVVPLAASFGACALPLGWVLAPAGRVPSFGAWCAFLGSGLLLVWFFWGFACWLFFLALPSSVAGVGCVLCSCRVLGLSRLWSLLLGCSSCGRADLGSSSFC